MEFYLIIQKMSNAFSKLLISLNLYIINITKSQNFKTQNFNSHYFIELYYIKQNKHSKLFYGTKLWLCIYSKEVLPKKVQN